MGKQLTTTQKILSISFLLLVLLGIAIYGISKNDENHLETDGKLDRVKTQRADSPKHTSHTKHTHRRCTL